MPTLAIARPSALQVQPADLPRLPPCVVSRPALLQRLLASESRLRLLCAPAGTGKSVLLGQCARHTPAAVERVWLDLGGRSLTPTQLCKRLAAAMQLPFDDGGEVGLIDRLHERAGRLWIFIDDYPRQADDELDACLDRLFAAAPQQVTWWVASRRTPAWNLPRLLLQGDLLELKGDELALDDAALNELLAALQMTLAQDVRQALLESSEGWLAAIRLLLLDVDEYALRQRLQAGCPLLRDYVQREVLADLDEELRSDLHALALLPRFSRSLCEHLLEGRGSELLGELQRRQLFVRSLDSSGTWFRLWRPLAEVLRLLPGAPASAPIHVRVCQWFAQHGDIREAVEHALLAGQVEVAVNYLQRFSQEQLLQGHSVAQFLQWREELPAWLFASSPRLIVLQAWALIICARFDEAADCIAIAILFKFCGIQGSAKTLVVHHILPVLLGHGLATFKSSNLLPKRTVYLHNCSRVDAGQVFGKAGIDGIPLRIGDPIGIVEVVILIELFGARVRRPPSDARDLLLGLGIRL